MFVTYDIKPEKDLEAVAKRLFETLKFWLARSTTLIHGPYFQPCCSGTFDRLEQRLDGTENDIEITRTATYPCA